jgi:quinoprotein glucose dehydrogenase
VEKSLPFKKLAITRSAWRNALLLTGSVIAGSAILSSSVAQVDMNLPAGPGRDTVAASCSQCHSLGLAVGKRHTPEEWSAVIQQMIGQGAQIDAQQANEIRDYLATHFGASGGAFVPPPPPAEPVSARTYPRPSGPNQWPAYGGGNANQNFSPLTQITPQNVSRLKQAWVYRYGAGQTPVGDQGLDFRFEVTPLIIGGVMYLSTPAAPSSPSNPNLKSSITALRPETGEVIWKFESPLNIHGRGLAYWPGDTMTAPRLIFGTDKGMIMAVDVTTGQLARDFGRNGQIDAYIGVSDEIVGESWRASYTIPNPVMIYKNLVITAARPGEVGPPGPRGDIRAFDAKTGRLVWDFHTIPWPGEPGHEGYVGDRWRGLTGANVWTTMTLDDQTGILYAPTGDANAPPGIAGPQLYANTLLALDANTGKLVWHRQITHHDVWDWDLPTPAMLLDVQQNGRTIPAVALTGKQSLFFLFDRRTGEPLNGFNEKPTPQPSTPDPNVWPTQPFPDAPGPLARTQMTRDEIPDLVPGMKAACQKIWDDNKTVSAPLYAPRSSPDHAVITYPSSTGGPNWGGGSFNPDLNLYFVNVQNRVTFSAASNAPLGQGHAPADPGVTVPNPSDRSRAAAAPARGAAATPGRGAAAAGRGGAAAGGGGRASFNFTTADGISLSCGALPWGEMVAVNVETKKIVWRAPLGMTEGIGAKGETTGSPNLGGSLATKSGLVFIGATNDRRFRAFDAKTGRKLWETSLEAGGSATPISYTGADGKQYVVIAAGGGTSVGQKLMSDTLVAYRLP